MGEGPGDGGGQVLRREQLLSELESLWGEGSGCLCHHLHTPGLRHHLVVLAYVYAGGGAEVARQLACRAGLGGGV